MRILGVDPGLASTGLAVVDASARSFRHVYSGVVTTDPGMAVGERLDAIYRAVVELIQRYKPREAGVESLYFAKNATSAIPVAQARGVVLLALAHGGIEAAEYPPQAIKQAIVGTGRAEKRQVQELVRIILGLTSVPASDHAADALAAAVCHYHSTGGHLVRGGVG